MYSLFVGANGKNYRDGFFAIAPTPLRCDGFPYRVTIKLPVILREIYTEEIIAL